MPSADQGASLALRGVSKAYNRSGAKAVDAIDLEIRGGEFVTLLGPSGSGKTTTLNMIAGFVQPTGGEILMDGSPIDGLPPHRRNIGVVFQHYALFPHMTAEENVAFSLKQRKLPKTEIQDRVSETLSLVELDRLGSRYPRQLSGGQQQRVALARAIVFRPRLLLMDEPLGALDRKLRDALQRQIRRLHRELGITFVYVTHDQDEALSLSERVAVFNQGRIEQVGAPDELYEKPASLFVAGFVGESNVLIGVAERGAGGDSVRCEELLIAARLNGFDPGATVALVARPERLSLRRDGHKPARDETVLPGAVTDVAYLGSTIRVEVTLDCGLTAIVRESAHETTGAAAGERVSIIWPADGCVALHAGTAEQQKALQAQALE